MIAPGDEWLAERARSGDEVAFAELVGRHGEAVRGMARAGVANLADADDLAQEIWLDAFRGLGGFDPDRPFWPWLRAVGRYRLYKFLKVAARMRERFVSLEEACPAWREARAPEEPPGGAEMDEAVQARLRALKPRNRMLLELYYIEGLPLPEVAARCGLTRGSAAQTLFRIRREIRSRLG